MLSRYFTLGSQVYGLACSPAVTCGPASIPAPHPKGGAFLDSSLHQHPKATDFVSYSFPCSLGTMVEMGPGRISEVDAVSLPKTILPGKPSQDISVSP